MAGTAARRIALDWACDLATRTAAARADWPSPTARGCGGNCLAGRRGRSSWPWARRLRRIDCGAAPSSAGRGLTVEGPVSSGARVTSPVSLPSGRRGVGSPGAAGRDGPRSGPPPPGPIDPGRRRVASVSSGPQPSVAGWAEMPAVRSPFTRRDAGPCGRPCGDSANRRFASFASASYSGVNGFGASACLEQGFELFICQAISSAAGPSPDPASGRT